MKKTPSVLTAALFICSVIALLGVVVMLSPSNSYTVLGTTIRVPRLTSILDAPIDSFSVEQQLNNVEAEMTLTAADSMRLALADSIAFYENFFAHSSSSISFPNGNYGYLFPLFRAMEGAEQDVVHIIHYGDSQIEGDRITDLLRDSLQALFGGSGPGLIPLFQPVPTRNVGQSLEGTHWNAYYAGGIMGDRAEHRRYGAMSQMAELHAPDTTVTLNVALYNGGRANRVVAFVGNVSDSGLNMTLSGDARRLEASPALKTISWTPSNRRNFSVTMSGEADIYGFELDGGRGVAISNIPMRGADGTHFSRIEKKAMSSMMRQLNTKMVIMEFGGNAMPMFKDTAKVNSWVKTFGRQIDYMRASCPEAQILVIGPADMSISIDGTLQTYPLLPYVCQEMRDVCHDRGVAFWDMYSVMGGRNSMLSWVSHKPAWAAPDYVHFTRRGAYKIAGLLWRALRMNYDYMLLLERAKKHSQDTSQPS